MADLKIGETFVDRIFIVDSTGAAKTGLSPSCTIIDESENRSAGTVAEMASGWYKVTDFTPDAAGTWCLEWAVAGAYTIVNPCKMFKVEGGLLADAITDLAAINTALTFQHQPDATLSQITPTQNIWYTILNTTANVRLYGMTVDVASTGETLEIRLTIDGNTLTGSTNAAAGTTYSVFLSPDGPALAMSSSIYFIVKYGFIEGRSIKLEMRKTTVAGTGTIHGRLIYAKR